jgi:starch synthase (maltosyl-transferring)
MVCLALPDYEVPADESYVVRDLLTDRTYTWRGPWNYVRLDPDLPGHILHVARPPIAKRADAAADMASPHN